MFYKDFINRVVAAIKREQYLPKFINRGLKVGKNFNRMSGVIIDPSHCYHITIGDNVTLAPRVHILAHDASTFIFFGRTRAANVTIGNNVFVGASSIILPGVKIGNDVVIGAGSVVTKDVPDGMVAVGNPAHIICTTEEYINKEKAKMCDANRFTGLWYEKYPNICQKAINAADKYGEIFVN